jgi:hypothetical protein
MMDCLIVEAGLETRLCPQRAVPEIPTATDGQSGLEVFVIFTDCSGTVAALQRANQLTKKLEARLRLLWPYEMPYTLSLTNPVVPVKILEEQLRALASRVPMNTEGHIYLCRDKLRTLRLVLKPGAIVILGGRKWWWSAERKLARALKNDGHHVIFTESE